MRELYDRFRNEIDGEDLVARTRKLCLIEQGQTFRHYRMAAEHVLAELKKYDIPNAELLTFPADGTTCFEDKKMPLAWDATVGKLTLCDAEQTVAADFTKHPFHLVKGSVSTAPGGETVRIITEQQLLAGEEPHGAMVMLESGTRIRKRELKAILDLGCRGFISDYLAVRYENTDDIQWVTACTESNSWHVTCEDRDFIGFSVSLRMGDQIRSRASHGVLKAKIECDGRRYAGELPAVTALIPGKRKEEVWILAHLYEPLLNDDSNGVTAGIEIARQIMKTGKPEYSLRLVFAMELYGYAAFHASFKGKAIGGANLDSMPALKGLTCNITPPITTVPFHGIDLLKEAVEGFDGAPSAKLTAPQGFDDMFLSDSYSNIPTVWFMWGGEGIRHWHSTAQTADDFLDPDVFADYTALVASWMYKTLNYTGPEAVLPPLELKKTDSFWRNLASLHVYRRVFPGQPHDLVLVPPEKRRPLPDGMIYGPFEAVYSRLDGKKDLEQVIMEAEAECRTEITDKDIKKYISALNFLSEYGYTEAVKRFELTGSMLSQALRDLGVGQGDVLLVHASVSACGYLKGGAGTLIDSVMDVCGPEGTALFTTFTRPYIYLGGLNRGWNYRPFDPDDISQIWTGETGKVLLSDYPDAVRSRHITHSWAGLGKHAAYCVGSHGPADAPGSENSPMGKALELGGKILYIGSGIAPTTFLHYLETEVDSEFLETALCKVRNKNGKDRVVSVEKHLPGHRDFYRPEAENCKFFRKAVENGLHIKEAVFGLGKLHLIDIRELHEIGLALLKEDKRLLLCDDPDCMFCRRF